MLVPAANKDAAFHPRRGGASRRSAPRRRGAAQCGARGRCLCARQGDARAQHTPPLPFPYASPYRTDAHLTPGCCREMHALNKLTYDMLETDVHRPEARAPAAATRA